MITEEVRRLMQAAGCKEACKVEWQRDELRRLVEIYHYRADIDPSPESVTEITDRSLRENHATQIVAAMRQKWMREHEMWERGLVFEDFDEEAERARLVPL